MIIIRSNICNRGYKFVFLLLLHAHVAWPEGTVNGVKQSRGAEQIL